MLSSQEARPGKWYTLSLSQFSVHQTGCLAFAIIWIRRASVIPDFSPGSLVPGGLNQLRKAWGQRIPKRMVKRLRIPKDCHRESRRISVPAKVRSLVLFAAVPLWAWGASSNGAQIRNAGFEASQPEDGWTIDRDEARQRFAIRADRKEVKEGHQSLLVIAPEAIHLTLRQEIF